MIDKKFFIDLPTVWQSLKLDQDPMKAPQLESLLNNIQSQQEKWMGTEL